MLQEARKYGLNLILANQDLEQLEEPLRLAILGNIGTLIAFRVAVPTAPAWLQRAGLGADVVETGAKQRGSGGGGR